MTIFAKGQNAELVLNGGKTQTRRLYIPDSYFIERAEDGQITALYALIGSYKQKKLLYRVGKSYPVQKHHMGHSMGRYICTAIRLDEDVRDITDEDIQAEAYESRLAYLVEWAKMHDKALVLRDDGDGFGVTCTEPGTYRISALSFKYNDSYTWLPNNDMLAYLDKRPANYYRAYVIHMKPDSA